MKILSIHPAAAAETREAIKHYEAQQDGLGDVFSVGLARAFMRLRTHPKTCPPYRRNGYRKCRVASFFYFVYFREFRNLIWIAVVAHASRRPGYWHARRPSDR